MQLHIDFLSVGGGGNLYDIMSIAIRSALYDLKIPRTRPVAYMQSGAAQGKAAGDEDEGEDVGMKALLKGRKNAKTQQDKQATAADFELLDYEADTGEHLRDRDSLTVAVSLYLVSVLLVLVPVMSHRPRGYRLKRCDTFPDTTYATAFPRCNALRIFRISDAPHMHISWQFRGRTAGTETGDTRWLRLF